jgi:hypothetical protein
VRKRARRKEAKNFIHFVRIAVRFETRALTLA